MAEVHSSGSGVRYAPYVPAETDLREFTLRALILGLIMAVILGAANAYLGLKAGMTIAATYPAAWFWRTCQPCAGWALSRLRGSRRWHWTGLEGERWKSTSLKLLRQRNGY